MAALSPAELGYAMPAEWEPHEATWLSWPHRAGISFPDSYDRIIPTFVKMAQALAESEIVRINVKDAAQEAEVRRLLDGAPPERVELHHIPTNEPWCRDHGPIFLKRKKSPRLAIVDFGYNAWGWKYPPCDDDDDVPAQIGSRLDIEVFDCGDFILEGGSIDVNGAGALLTTESCLLNPNRNPDLTREDIEKRLRDTLGVKTIIWLGDGIEGDDTDGHVDDLTRFVGPNSVVTVVEDDENDANYDALRVNLERLREVQLRKNTPLEIRELPMPSKIVRDGQRLPASYANFYIANSVVLLPVFAETNDAWAEAVLKEMFPDRTIVPIDCRELIWGLGAFHCLTQQQPRA
ncbi:MAG: agmatine deiminase family protein [Terrimicrobiaceae bacterium]|nr:agmatine deiminase family protein [Terrimicrobiaceae bacterium]